MTNDDAKQALLAAATLAKQWQDLCKLYKLAPNASIEALENAIRHEGFAHAILSVMGAIGDINKAEKQSYRNGNGSTLMH